MTSSIQGKIKGVGQDDVGFYALFEQSYEPRYLPAGWNHLRVPITSEQFHGLKLDVPVTLVVMIQV